MARAWKIHLPASVLGLSIGCGLVMPLWAQTSPIVPAAAKSEGAPSELGPSVIKARPLAETTTAAVEAAYEKTQTAKTSEDYTEIIDLCQKALRSQPDAASAKYLRQLLAWAANRRGEAHSQAAAELAAVGKTDEAAKLDAEALADFSTAVTNDPSKWKSLHNRGVSLALLARYEEALDDLTKAIELKSDYVNTWFNRAEVRYELGQYADAAADYGEVIRRQPDDFGAYTGRGHAYFRMGDFDKALADYHKSVTLDATSPGALVNRGDTFRQKGEWDKAAADYRAAVKIDEKYGRAFRSAAWLMATCPDDRLRNPELAVQAATKAIELDGTDDYIYLDTLATAYASAGKFQEAIEAAQQALAAAPEEAKIAVKQRLTLIQAGKPYRLPTQTASRPTPARR